MSKTETTYTFSPERDKYGRSTHALRSYYPAYRTLGYVVRLPKSYIERYGKDRSYLTNDWTAERTSLDLEEAGIVRYHRTLAQAKAALLTQVQA